MTSTVSRGAEPPPLKTPISPLDVRAPRPPVVRLRRSVVIGLGMIGAGLVAGSLAWAFVIQPDLRARGREAAIAKPNETNGPVRPSERVTGAPATYGDLKDLPEPRTLTPSGSPERPGPTAQAAPHRREASPSARAAEEARSSTLFFTSDRAGITGRPSEGSANADHADLAAIHSTPGLQAPASPYEVQAGAVIAAALLTGVDSARKGPVTATVTENVYDTVTGRFLLIPQGARLIGSHEGESRYGDKRAFIAWNRLILPNGKSISLPGEPGVDEAGSIGVAGQVDRRLAPLGIATLFAGAITALGQAARDRDNTSSSFLGDAGDAAAITAAQVGGKLIDRELEVRPSIRLSPGALVRVFLTRDLILEPYGP